MITKEMILQTALYCSGFNELHEEMMRSLSNEHEMKYQIESALHDSNNPLITRRTTTAMLANLDVLAALEYNGMLLHTPVIRERITKDTTFLGIEFSPSNGLKGITALVAENDARIKKMLEDEYEEEQHRLFLSDYAIDED